MGDLSDTEMPRYGGQPIRESSACAEDGVLSAILHVACEPGREDPIDGALDTLVTTMGLSRASLAEVRIEDGLRHLEPVAASGEHAPFARDMPAVLLEQMPEAATAVTERRALYVADVHGLGEAPLEAGTGVARWRQGMSAQAHALLPVIAGDEVVGVLTVEWSSPQEFTAVERKSLEAVALLFGLILEAKRPAQAAPTEPGSATEDRARRAPSGPSLMCYDVTERGVVVPEGAGESLPENVMLHVTVASGEPDETTCPFWDVVGVGHRALVVVGGTVQAPRGAAASLALECGKILRASTSHGRSPAEALHTLSTWLITSGPGSAFVSAGCWRVDMGRGSVTSSVAGAIASAHRSSEGRMAVSVSECPALGANAGRLPSDEYSLVLPGDTLTLCAGSVAWMRAEAGQRALARALEIGNDSGRRRLAAERLAGLAADASITPLIAVIDVLGG